MKKFRVLIPVFVLVLFIQACDGLKSALTITYAFRKAESIALRDPAIGGKITDVNVQRKINALEGEFDSGWNCAYSAYESAASTVPEGQPVSVTAANFKPCMDRAWTAAFQLLDTIRAFKPDFLTTSTTVTSPSGAKLVYEPIQSSTIPPDMPLIPATKVSL